jgi:hypothetical protein
MATDPAIVHPFFSPASPYRLCTQTSVWADGGKQSVRDFFERRRRRDLHLKWVSGESGQDWMGGDDEGSRRANEAINAFLASQAGPPPKGSKERRAVPVGAKGPRPVLLKFDLGGDAPVLLGEPLDTPGSLFTGIGQENPLASTQFRVEVPGLPPRRHVLVLLLEEKALRTLAGLVGVAASGKWQAAPLDVLSRALSPADLSVRPGDGPDRPARRLQRAWASLPGLERRTDENGWFVEKVNLPRPAQLDSHTWVLLCLGPTAA